ncbi:hypothetical protein B0H14DRAFT_3446844 [Mycena olivaceomarginata]|nr:hypothetical protein B0H14DRAFT_3446844 [Mycena olivaceomarginata]
MIYAQLLDENLVTAEQVPRCRAILRDVSTIDPRTLLFRMDQQFRVSFNKPLQPSSASGGQTPPTTHGLALHSPVSSLRLGPSIVDDGWSIANRQNRVARRGRGGAHLKPEAGQLLSAESFLIRRS